MATAPPDKERGRPSAEISAVEEGQHRPSTDQTTVAGDMGHTEKDAPADGKNHARSSPTECHAQKGGTSRLELESDWEVVADGGVGDDEPSSSSPRTCTHSVPYTASLDIKVGWGRWKYTVFSRQWECLVHFTHENPPEATQPGEDGTPSVEEKRG